MRVESVTLCNFRCFGPDPVTIGLDELTGFVGTNGCGKTAVLQALARLFGTSSSERRLQRGDFHIPFNKAVDDLTTNELFIEVRLTFPELADGVISTAVPECFQHMVIEEEGAPFCRVRLEGTWTATDQPDGVIEERIFWVQAPGTRCDDADKRRLKPFERTKIQVHYIPGSRDPANQLKNVSGTLLSRLLRAVQWSDPFRTAVEDVSKKLAEHVEGEAGIQIIHDVVEQNWQTLHEGPVYSEPRLKLAGGALSEILEQVGVIFKPSADGETHDVSRLSDGQKSLFYLALISSIYEVEQMVVSDAAVTAQSATDGPDLEIRRTIAFEESTAPIHTIFAIEEPENHLAPHYLGRILKLLRRIAGTDAAQVVLSSHSPAIIGRLDPAHLRHIRLDATSRIPVVSRVTLPDGPDEVCKYVRQAVKAYPELYFAQLVVLGEGDSEEIVLPRIAESRGVGFDTSFVAVVPLGGRHVQYFWKLLSDLGIPYVTLLDLDRERGGGGWGRIKYVCEQLRAIGADSTELLTEVGKNGMQGVVSPDELAAMHRRDVTDDTRLGAWLEKFEQHGVFFSAPLDLDFLMLVSYPETYTSLYPDGLGPNQNGVEAIHRVLGKAGADGGTYVASEQELFGWYGYLFLTKGKPATHLQAMAMIDPADLRAKAPPVLTRLISRVTQRLNHSE